MDEAEQTRRGRRKLPPVELRRRWLDARREELLVRWGKRSLVVLLLLATAALLGTWWVGQAYLQGRERALADACADSPFAIGSVTAAGGPEEITAPDHPALDPYRGDPEGRTAAALRIRDHAALLDDRTLATAAVNVARDGPFVTVVDIARVERACAGYLQTGPSDR